MTTDHEAARARAAIAAYPTPGLPARNTISADTDDDAPRPPVVRLAVATAERYPHSVCCDLTGTERRDPIEDWQPLAACIDQHPDDFFPGRGENNRINRAKAICATCPVRPECLKQALDNHELYGVWGGSSERERRLIRRGVEVRLGRPPKPIAHGTVRGHAQERRAGIEPCWACRAAYNANERALRGPRRGGQGAA